MASRRGVTIVPHPVKYLEGRESCCSFWFAEGIVAIHPSKSRQCRSACVYVQIYIGEEDLRRRIVRIQRDKRKGADTRPPKIPTMKTPILGLASSRLHSDPIRIYVHRSFLRNGCPWDAAFEAPEYLIGLSQYLVKWSRYLWISAEGLAVCRNWY